MGNSRFARPICLIAALCVASTIAAPAQTFTTILSFDSTNGSFPLAPLTQGRNGNFFGTTTYGGIYIWGAMFEVAPSGAVPWTYSFCASGWPCADGINPQAGLILAPDGDFYGTSYYGGSQNAGTIFALTPDGTLNTLYNFCSLANCADGFNPGALVQGHNGNFLGTTWNGGAVSKTICPYECGTIFEVTAKGALTTLHDFCSRLGCPDGASPAQDLVIGSNGNLYGTTSGGGAGTVKAGTLYVLTSSSKFSILHTFNAATDGQDPDTLIMGTDGNLYGTAPLGGIPNYCYGGCGTIFRMTPAGVFTTLYKFCSKGYPCADGSFPTALIQGADGNLYGTTSQGGNPPNANCVYGCGTIFKITPGGELTTLYAFCGETGCPDGDSPEGLTQSTSGTFYGITEFGGTGTGNECNGCGTVFSLSLGLQPFVLSNPVFGRVGYEINILGNKLTDATTVTFNGVPATFIIKSDTYIRAQVPSGATTGAIEVTTPSGTLSSNVAFQVIP